MVIVENEVIMILLRLSKKQLQKYINFLKR